jgi:hypothetical protein
MQMEKIKLLDQMGFLQSFINKLWSSQDGLDGDVCTTKNGELPLFKLNFGVITLLSKKEDASMIEQYRPICLLNISFKTFTNW